MEKNLENIAYNLLNELISGILNKDQKSLEQFGITAAIYEEIIEELERSGENTQKLMLPPRDIAFTKHKGSIPIDIFEMNDKETWGIECDLWSDGQKTELTLCAGLEPHEANAYRLKYRLIETQ